jgi:hypothetical protein
MKFACFPYDVPRHSLADRPRETHEGTLINIDDRELQQFKGGQWVTIERCPPPERWDRAPGALRFDPAVGLLKVPLWYPRQYDPADSRFDQPRSVEIDLVCVRAADSIRVEYDFERDGYSIKQASKFEWDEDDEEQDPDWQEVAFVEAWARDERRKARTVETDRELLTDPDVATIRRKLHSIGDGFNGYEALLALDRLEERLGKIPPPGA